MKAFHSSDDALKFSITSAFICGNAISCLICLECIHSKVPKQTYERKYPACTTHYIT